MPPDKYPPQQPPNGPTNLPSINTGHTIVVLSVLFFLIIGYVTLFSAFIPPPSNFVRDPDIHRCRPSDCGKGLEICGGRCPLQVPRTVFDTHLFLLRHRELGGLAILPELLMWNVSSVDWVEIHTLIMLYDN